jgi:hypothetical protein
LASLTLLAGCGGVSQAEFVRRADGLCTRFRQEARPLLGQQTRLPRARNLRRLHALMLNSVTRLRRLTPPRGDEDQVARYLAGVKINASRVRQLATALERNQRRRVKKLRAELSAGTAATRVLAAQYGFKVCGSG